MLYVYPKLSEIDLGFTRIGGLGLGNMLFAYARALLCTRDYDAEMIWPTWNSIPIGQIMRGDKNKRYYNDLFENRRGAVTGFKKCILRCFGRKVSEEEFCRKAVGMEAGEVNGEKNVASKGKVIEFTGMEGEFRPLMGGGNSRFIAEHLKSILQDRNRKALEFEPGNGICIHVRLGDFTRGGTKQSLKDGTPNMSIPIAWYAGLIKQIREAVTEEFPVYVFSDGSREELKALLELPGVERKSFETAIGDILAMSKAKLFIASGSTFSRWVRYLGQMNSINYPGQMKQELLEDDSDCFEIEAEEVPEEYLKRIQGLLQSHESGRKKEE